MTHSKLRELPLMASRALPPKKTMLELVGSTLTTLSYQHCAEQMSGALVLIQVLPPSVVLKTPRLLRDARERPVSRSMLASAIEAYTVFPVVSAAAMPRSMRPKFAADTPAAPFAVTLANVIALHF